jgi:hypothetical protein
MEVLTTAAAMAIGKIALDKFVEGGAGELGKQLTTSARDKLMELANPIWKKIRGNKRAVEVLTGAAADNAEDVQALKNYLATVWGPMEFAEQMRDLANDLHFELTQIQNNSPIVMHIADGGVGYATNIPAPNSTNFVGGVHHHKYDKPPS